MIVRLLILMAGILLVVQPAKADEYDLQAVISLAIERNKTLKLAQAEVRMASALKKEAVSAALPSLDLDFGYNRNLRDNFFFINTPQGVERFSITFKNEYQFNAVLSQTLFSLKVGKSIQAASDFRKFTDFRYEHELKSIIILVKKAFYQALLQRAILAVARDSEINARENYENIRLKFESGVASEFDLLQAEVRWQNLIPETMEADKDYRLAISDLKALLSLPESERMELVGNLDNYPSPPDSMALSEVLMNRPDYNALLWEKKLREKNIFVQRAEYLPVIDGNVIYNYGARSNEFSLENDNDNVIIGATLRIPLFTGGFGSAQIQKARVDLQKTNTQIDMSIDNIQIEMTNVYLRLRNGVQRIQAAERSIDSAQRAFEIAEARAANNQATQLELKDSRVFLDQARLSYYSAIFDYLVSYFDWEIATGNVSTSGL